MALYAIVSISLSGDTGIVLFDSLADVESYKITHAFLLIDYYLWYVVEILERSRSEGAAAAEITYDMENRNKR